MKVRNGFVSNSSTSSFVVLGYKVEYDEEDLKDIITKIDPEALKKIDMDSEDVESDLEELFSELVDYGSDKIDFFRDRDGGELYAGALIACVSSDEGTGSGEFKIDEIMAKCKNAKEIFGFEGEPKLHTGTICS
jgi:hypothetical protein